MADVDQGYETPKWRTLSLVVGFTLLIGVGVVTVLLPELEDEPESTGQPTVQSASQE